jgi:hypothetical protein
MAVTKSFNKENTDQSKSCLATQIRNLNIQFLSPPITIIMMTILSAYFVALPFLKINMESGGYNARSAMWDHRDYAGNVENDNSVCDMFLNG